jgi:hypothetical protein
MLEKDVLVGEGGLEREADMTEDSLIVVPDGTPLAGRVVWWRLEGVIEHETLAEAWLEAGLEEDLLPSPPSVERALKRALGTWSGKRVLVRPLGRDVRGYALVEETAESSDLSHETELTVKLEKDDDGRDVLVVDPAGHELAVDVRRRFAEATMEFDSRASSTWLTSLVEGLDTVKLAPKKGFYFVPRDKLEIWDRYVAAVREVSDHHFFEIPTMKVAGAVEAILDAVTVESGDLVDAIAKDLDDPELELGKRALRTRVGKLELALEKIGRYEELLDEKLDAVRDRVGDIRANVATALLMAETEEDDEKGQATP